MLIDAHTHILPASFSQRHAELLARDATYASLFPNPSPRLATTEDLVQEMEQAGIERSVVMGMGWTDSALAAECNDYIIQSVFRYPDRILGFCSVNPALGDDAVAEVKRCARAGLSGIGELHADTQGFDITDRSLMRPLMDAARDLGMPVAVHASEPVGHLYPGKGRTTPDKVYRFIENFPENIIICAHWGGGLPFYALMPEVPKVMKNVYFDSAASPFLYRPEVFAAVVGLAGADKVLFGTDYPLIGQRRLLKQVAASGLDISARQAILGRNVARLLGL
jgi:predicted TIM-barrel fold metal-dependent hydrolase